MRVGIVNDLKLAVRALTDVLATEDDCDVAWIAEDGEQAVAYCAENTPDIVLMDMIMPVMDGVEATRRIMQESPCAILVVTATVEGNLNKVYEALGAGALDAVDGPRYGSGAVLENTQALLRKIDTIRRLQDLSGIGAASHAPPPVAPHAGAAGKPLVVIGASTGGPDALAQILAGLPDDLETPIVVVQHLDKQFVPGLLVWLGHHTKRKVVSAVEGERPERGVVSVAHGDDHLVLGADGRFHYEHEPADLVFRPSADVFFGSVARRASLTGVAVLLTGMGKDGARGMLALRERGWATIAQDEASSVVYGMPKAAKELGAAVHITPLTSIASMVQAALRRQAGSTPANG